MVPVELNNLTVKSSVAPKSAAPKIAMPASVTGPSVLEMSARWRLLSWVDASAVAALEFLERSRDIASELVVVGGGSLHR